MSWLWRSLFCFAAIVTPALAQDVQPVAHPKVKKSLVIAWDGVRSDALIRADTPNFDALGRGKWAAGYRGRLTTGAYAVNDAAAWSAPNHWAIMTGATATQSGVFDNSKVWSGDSKKFPHYLTLLERHDATLGTAYLFTWEKDVQIPCGADYLKLDSDADNVKRLIAMLRGTYSDAKGALNSAWTRGKVPDALFLFLDGPDYAGHRHGFTPEARKYLDAIERADAQLGQILVALRARPSFEDEDWQIVVTADHGGTASGHGGRAEIEYRIPFLIAGRTIRQSALKPYDVETLQGTRNLDVVPSVLGHFGVQKPPTLTGTSYAEGCACGK